MCRCQYCYRSLEKGEKDFHANCAKKFFGTKEVPVLNYTCEDLEKLAIQVIKDQTSLTGVQPKLSLHLDEHEGSQRLTIVGLYSKNPRHRRPAPSYSEVFSGDDHPISLSSATDTVQAS